MRGSRRSKHAAVVEVMAKARRSQYDDQRRDPSAASTSSRCSPRCEARTGVQRAVRIARPQAVERKARHSGVGSSATRSASRASLEWRDRVDQRSAGVVDPVHVLRLGVGGRERHAALQLVGERQRPGIPEGDVTEHSRPPSSARSPEGEADPRPDVRPGREGARRSRASSSTYQRSSDMAPDDTSGRGSRAPSGAVASAVPVTGPGGRCCRRRPGRTRGCARSPRRARRDRGTRPRSLP